MAWNVDTNTWTTPAEGGTFGAPAWADIWAQYVSAHPEASGTWNAGQNAVNFSTWWAGPGQQYFMNQWNQAWDPWNETLQGWLTDSDWSTPAPEAPDLGQITDWSNAQLYGTDGEGGIYSFMEALAAELAAGGQQYYGESRDLFAKNAGFENAEELQAWLDTQGEIQSQFQETSLHPELSGDQRKALNAQMREAEANARKQAERMYQETGSLATLQRASDELNRANVSDSFKMQLEMERENFARALSGVSQQTDIIMREVEAGERSFANYVDAKQRGVAGALASWQERAAQVLRDAEMQIGAATGQYQMDLAQWQADRAALENEGQRIREAAALAMGVPVDMLNNLSEVMNQYWQTTLQPMIDAWTLQAELDANPLPSTEETTGALPPGLGPGDEGLVLDSPAGRIIIGGFLVFLGILVAAGTGWTGAGALIGTGIAGVGTSMISGNVGG